MSKLIHLKTETQANAIKQRRAEEANRLNLDRTLAKLYNRVDEQGIDAGQLKEFQMDTFGLLIEDRLTFYKGVEICLLEDGWQDVEIKHSDREFDSYFKVSVRRPQTEKTEVTLC